MKHRLFVGIPISAEVKERVLALMFQLKKIKTDVNFVPPENLHFTLKFLGDVEDLEIPSIHKKLATLCSKKHSFDLSVSTVGAFPSSEKINVIWAGGSQELLSLMKEIDTALNNIKKNDYSEDIPHLTIARVKLEKEKLKNEKELKDFLQIHNDDFFGTMTVRTIILYKSELATTGPVYSIVQTYNFRS
ncbi:RNA 2',3'-cyclic phosphodiesterase [Candidatus Woesearchaeota archaeon]|nr:RNA 2',3'-cyclic phosphodiesterase [Candidatus Woesearchaeota archaeon]